MITKGDNKQRERKLVDDDDDDSECRKRVDTRQRAPIEEESCTFFLCPIGTKTITKRKKEAQNKDSVS